MFTKIALLTCLIGAGSIYCMGTYEKTIMPARRTLQLIIEDSDLEQLSSSSQKKIEDLRALRVFLAPAIEDDNLLQAAVTALAALPDKAFELLASMAKCNVLEVAAQLQPHAAQNSPDLSLLLSKLIALEMDKIVPFSRLVMVVKYLRDIDEKDQSFLSSYIRAAFAHSMHNAIALNNYKFVLLLLDNGMDPANVKFNLRPASPFFSFDSYEDYISSRASKINEILPEKVTEAYDLSLLLQRLVSLVPEKPTIKEQADRLATLLRDSLSFFMSSLDHFNKADTVIWRVDNHLNGDVSLEVAWRTDDHLDADDSLEEHNDDSLDEDENL